jgi:murein L,D-transpeptidase YafK
MRDGIIRFAAGSMLAAFCLSFGTSRTADALEVVLNDVAADRVERQRRFIRNEIPLPGTPDLAKLDERLKARDLAEGRPIYIRIFKAESELELWLQNSKGTFTKLATYPICHWYGSLGPKLKEGDKQSPEGFYRVGTRQTRLVGRWRKAFNLGFPNTLDQKLNRTGSYILLHGGCSSVGCFAMTDPVQDEIYGLARAALAKGQERFSVHIFPFRMTAENMARYAKHEAAKTWVDLKPAYDSFERTHVPPQVALCGTRYKIADGLPGETGGTDRRLPVLRTSATDDGTAARDADAAWAAPACQFDDEERRITYYNGGTVGASATTTATIGKVAEAPEEPTPSPVRKSEPHHHAKPAHSTKQAVASKPPAASPRPRTPSRPHRRGTLPPRRITGVPSADGFGSSALRGTLRISTHGG